MSFWIYHSFFLLKFAVPKSFLQFHLSVHNYVLHKCCGYLLSLLHMPITHLEFFPIATKENMKIQPLKCPNFIQKYLTLYVISLLIYINQCWRVLSSKCSNPIPVNANKNPSRYPKAKELSKSKFQSKISDIMLFYQYQNPVGLSSN